MADQPENTCAPRPSCPVGYEILQDPLRNKGISFTEKEQKVLKLEGLLPPGFNSMEQQVTRMMENFRKKSSDLEKYNFMMALLERDRTLFDRVVLDYLEEIMPIIYTPTVGRASQEYSHIFQRPQGLFLSEKYRGRLSEVIGNWPIDDVRIVCVTDGERILGLGDLGVSGMAIPVGKLSLYVACAGIHPSHCLPIVIDVGTNNVSLLNDPLYLGLKHERIRGEAYDALIDEFVEAVRERYPDALIHFEDFGNLNAFRLLKKYRDRICTFNDDIQGTAAVALAGLYGAMKMTGGTLTAQKILFLGAGGAGIGIGELIVSAMVREGMAESEARKRCWFTDSRGLVVRGRERVSDAKRPFAHEHEPVPDFLTAIRRLQPTAIIGVSGQAGRFGKDVLRAMADLNDRPLIFALSNPTSKSECTAEEAYTWTDGRAIFSSGSPFGLVTLEGQIFAPGQGNNAYIFPGVGLGIVTSEARRITDEMFLAAARTLADQVSPADFDQGRIYPPLKAIRAVSAQIAVAVAEIAWASGLARHPRPEDPEGYIKKQMYVPEYQRYV
ncbi:NAD-dependent malic enzyme [Desulfonema ishimotonii]|uniref:NAD-dependent malic enzyme n=1 Tax=Desulfonema ishimotonii TaxID=45657 RepID=A0A401FRW9_9BACT|nr:NAD-dependent malic enzyme [Desulfonema ishimotonii]GBC59719.1 NAD-dependent malic enzyme [Desulfonema ishimotonii]